MSPILGIYASQISGHLFAPSGAYDSIATVDLSGGAASSITFSSIPSTYKHLQIRGISRNTAAADDMILRFNSDSGSNYAWHVIRGNGSAATATNGAPTTAIEQGIMIYSGQLANAFSVNIIDVVDYADTSKFKTLKVLNGSELNGSGAVTIGSGVWRSTSAVSTVVLTMGGGGNFAQYSHFGLYGIKGN